MIYTCTITPSLDYTTYLQSFESGALNRTKDVYYYPGGKGINVSRVLKRLDTDSVAIGYAGGFVGAYIERFLQDEGISTHFIETETITRINVKIKAEVETELNGPGPVISMEDQQQLIEKIQSMEENDWFVLAGSLPEEIPVSFFEKIASVCAEKGIRFVLDTSGPALKKLKQTKPFLMKPNDEELGELFDTTIQTKGEAFYYAKKLVALGVEHVVVSLGGDGALLVTKELSIAAKAPTGKVVNTVGAGDSLVAGFIAAYGEQKDAKEAFRFGVASGSATAFRSDLCEKSDVLALIDKVKIIDEADVKR